MPIPCRRKRTAASIRMMWTDSPCRITCWNGGNETELALRNPEIETIVAQHPWLENDCLYADIILPANTHMEVEDIVTNIRQGTPQPNIMICDKAIDPVGESKSDFEVVLEVAKKLGHWKRIYDPGDFRSRYDEKNMGSTWVAKNWFPGTTVTEKKYWMYNTAEDWKTILPGLRQFYTMTRKSFRCRPRPASLSFIPKPWPNIFPMTRSGRRFPNGLKRSTMHDERLSSHRAKVYPLLLMSNHGRWRVHSQCDDITWTREVGTCKVTGPDGYKYEPLWMHTSEAKKRGIRHGDIVKIFNRPRNCTCRRICHGTIDARRGLHRSWRPGRCHQSR